MEIYIDGICPVCGAHMAGANTESMKCLSCGCEEAICREDIEAFMRIVEEQEKKRRGGEDA